MISSSFCGIIKYHRKELSHYDILVGAGQIGMAVARRISFGKKLVIADKSPANAAEGEQ